MEGVHINSHRKAYLVLLLPPLLSLPLRHMLDVTTDSINTETQASHTQADRRTDRYRLTNTETDRLNTDRQTGCWRENDKPDLI